MVLLFVMCCLMVLKHQGIYFVEKLREIINQNELYNSEEQAWLTLLLQLVDVTKPAADEHLKKFLSKGNSPVVKMHRAHLIEQVCICRHM